MYERTYYQEHNPGWLEKDRSEKEFWDLEHADKLSDWRQLLGMGTGSLLDVGCSGGLLIEYAESHGWRAEGIEPSEVALAETRRLGLKVHPGLYRDVELPPRSFDVVYTKLLFEHLPRPRDFLEWAARVLRPGGILSVQAPNDFNPLQLAARDLLGKQDWWVAPPFHINYFSFDSLERLLRSAGYAPVMRDTTFPMEWFLLMGEDYVGDDQLGLLAHKKRMSLESRLEPVGLRRSFHAYLAQRGLGREAIVHARRAG